MKLLWLCLFVTVNAFGVTNEELERKINILADEINQLKASQQKVATGEQAYGLGMAASKVYFVSSGLSIGGYGEISYVNKAAEKENGDATNREPETEALRNVIYLGYKFNDKWIMNTEIEIEHVNEIYSEFMYVDYLASESLNYRFGLSLIPMGLTNELHEPIYFNSVQRPEVEKYLIPTTWREVGVGAFGSVGNWNYKAFIFNGADADAISGKFSDGIRKGRKKGGAGDTDSTQNASTHAIVLRGDYQFDSANSAGASIYRGQASSLNSTKNYIDMDLNIIEVHSIYKQKAFGAKFLYSRIDFANSKEWNEQAASTNYIPELMDGGYLEFSYDIEASQGALYVPFVRYETYDLNKKVDSDYLTKDKSLDRRNTVIGVAYKPLDRLVFKADYAYKKQADEKGANEFNLGLGFVY